MPTNVGKLSVVLSANTGRFGRDMKVAKKQVTGMTASVKKLAVGLAAAFGARAVVRGLTSFIKVASDAEEAAAKFNTVFGKAAVDTRKSLDKFADEVGRSRFELQSMAGDLGALIGPMGFTERATGDLSVKLAKLATDLASFNNVSEERALTALRSGLVGESEPLRRFGVQLSAARIEAEAFATGLARTKREMTPLIKAQAAFNIIMRDTKVAQGDAARTADGMANQLKKLQGAWHDLSVELGEEFLPTATSIISRLAELTKGINEVKQSGVGLKLTAAGLVSLFDVEELVNPSPTGIPKIVQDVIDQANAAANKGGKKDSLLDLRAQIRANSKERLESFTADRAARSGASSRFSGRIALLKAFGIDTTGIRQEDGQLAGQRDRFEFGGKLVGRLQTLARDLATPIETLTGKLISATFGPVKPTQAPTGPQFTGAFERGTTAEFSQRIRAMGLGGKDDAAKKTEKNTGETSRGIRELIRAVQELGVQDPAVLVSI